MKKITCRQMGGPCDEVFEGSTKEEIIEKGTQHVMSVQDDEHKAIAESMPTMSEEEKNTWYAEFENTWNSTTEE